MKAVRFISHVTVLMLMLLGIYLIGTYIGGDDDFHGKVPFIPSRHPLASWVVILFWMLLPFVTRFTIAELLVTALVAQLVVVAWVTLFVYAGGHVSSSDWVFRGWLIWVRIYAELLALPFAVTIVAAVLIRKLIRSGQPPIGGDVKPAPQP